jgi:hypothetical protein
MDQLQYLSTTQNTDIQDMHTVWDLIMLLSTVQLHLFPFYFRAQKIAFFSYRCR